jgi:hypothetical protein
MFERWLSLLLLAACGACSDNGSKVDATITVDIDNGSCGDQLRFTGEYVDWDTDASFCGINGAVVQEANGGMDTTAPNGRFDVCLSRATSTTTLQVTQPTGMSPCTVPSAAYTIPTILFVHHGEVLAGGFYSARAFTTARQQTFFQDAGLVFDPSKAQVLVYVNGTPRAVSLQTTHQAPQAVTGTTWGPGDIGKVVFFPNVDVDSGTTQLSVAGGAIGTGAIPLVAGTLTNVTVIAP